MKSGLKKMDIEIKEFVTTNRRYSNPRFNINAEILD